MKQRALSFLLAAVLTLALAVPAFAAGGFSDVPGNHWAYDDIMTCAQQGIVSGFEDGRFKPNDKVTGIQFIVMITRTFFQEELADTQKEAAGKEWYWPNTTVALLNGLSYGIVIDDSAINRYDMAYVLYRTLVHFGKASPSIRDTSADYVISSIRDWSKVPKDYQMAVKSCYAAGILTGTSDGSFSGSSSMTRAQACAVTVRMMELIGVSTPAAPVQPTTPAQPQQPEAPAVTGTGKLANGQPATVENVQAILEEIKKEYPAGTPWGPPGTPNNNYYRNGHVHALVPNRDVMVLNNTISSSPDGVSGGRADMQYACGGWVCMVSERIFGQTGAPCREVTDASKIRPGDIVYKFSANDIATHLAIVYGVDILDDGAIVWRTCDGNVGAEVQWDDPIPNLSYSSLPGLGKENASSRTGVYYRIWTRYPD